MRVSMPSSNADGEPIVPLTEEQRYRFDTDGWIVVPGVLGEDQLQRMREFCLRLKDDRDSLASHEQTSIGGALLPSIDHPVVVGFMNEFVAHGFNARENCYGFRLESSALFYRSMGDDNFRPHGGGGYFNLGGNSHIYRMQPGAVNAGLTRVVWELNPVKKGQGGTRFISGSHKAAFPVPKSVCEDRGSPLWDTYECPAGSLLVFTEAITHTGDRWTDEEFDRMAIFRCYNTLASKWHAWQPPAGLVETMHPLRQSLFRSVHNEDNFPDESGGFPAPMRPEQVQ